MYLMRFSTAVAFCGVTLGTNSPVSGSGRKNVGTAPLRTVPMPTSHRLISARPGPSCGSVVWRSLACVIIATRFQRYLVDVTFIVSVVLTGRQLAGIDISIFMCRLIKRLLPGRIRVNHAVTEFGYWLAN